MTSPAVPHDLTTRLVHAGRPPRVPGGPVNPPLVLSATFHAGGEPGYGRYGNPLWSALEDAMADLEGACGAVAFASGMAATHAVLDLVPVGARLALPDATYFETAAAIRQRAAAGLLRVLPVADPTRLDDWAAAAAAADVLWLEPLTNPMLRTVDVAAVAALKRPGATVVVDATLATPVLLRPLEAGADVVLHSGTKQLTGHSDALIGVVAAADGATADRLRDLRAQRGSTPGALETHLCLRGIRTLGLRVERAQATAAELALRLGTHPAVRRVHWPGWGTLVSFEVQGTPDAADRVARGTTLWTHATSLGDVTSLIERRRRWADESKAVPATLLRLSVGIEHIDDLWCDLAAALDAALDTALGTAGLLRPAHAVP